MDIARRISFFVCFILSVFLVGVLAWNAGIHESAGADGSIICGPGGAPITVPAASLSDATSNTAIQNRTTSDGFMSFFTNGDTYMPRVHCMVNEAGTTDWPWVWVMLGLNAIVIGGYAKIFIFWRRAYLNEAPKDRNKKLMDMAWIFLWCAVCGYAASITMFVWPAYRLVAIFLVPLAFFTWRFCGNLQEMSVSLSAKRLERQLEEALMARNIELEKEVDARTIELRDARDAARNANDAKSDFVATMSHEVRTPLNAILGYSAMIAEGGIDDAERLRLAGVIERNGDHLATVVNDVLDLSKIESRKLTFERIDWSPGEIVTDVVALMEAEAAQKGIKLSANIDGAIPTSVIGDPTRARQVLLNLTGNAVKFSEQGSVCITARATKTAHGCEISYEVKDTGIGMTQSQLSTIFQPFTQADPGTTRKYGGSGLGLTIARHLCELMGGSLDATSKVGVGSAFTAVIAGDLNEHTEWTESLETCDIAPEPEAQPSGRTGRILLADDSIDNRRLFVTLLRKMGHEVDEAEDGLEALEIVETRQRSETPFELILMDLDMPRCNGETAMRKIHDSYPDLPVVALTAHTMSGVREKLIACGFDDYASKPIRKAALAALCDRWLGRANDNQDRSAA